LRITTGTKELLIITPFFVFLGAVIGGVGDFIRGSYRFEKWTGRGSGTARLMAVSAPLTILAVVFGLPWQWALPLFLAIWAGTTLPWLDTSKGVNTLKMGREDGEYAKAWALHTLIGVGRTLIPPLFSSSQTFS
jgi:hypothetical protein